MLTDIHYQEIIKQQLVKIKQQAEAINGAYNVLNDLAEQEFFLKHIASDYKVNDLQDHINQMAITAAKERTDLDKYLRGELYAN